MPLVLKSNTNGSADDYNVLHGELQIGQIYKRQAALTPGTRWLWALNGVPECPEGLAFTGHAASLDDAIAALNARWAKWLVSADLIEAANSG
jgi:hypothetical protein